MNKPIEWHEANIQYRMDRLNEEEEILFKKKQDVEFYQYQVSEAKKNGKISFDASRFRIKVKK